MFHQTLLIILMMNGIVIINNTQDWRLHKAFANNLSAHIKFSKTPLHKIEQLAGSLRRLLR